MDPPRSGVFFSVSASNPKNTTGCLERKQEVWSSCDRTMRRGQCRFRTLGSQHNTLPIKHVVFVTLGSGCPVSSQQPPTGAFRGVPKTTERDPQQNTKLFYDRSLKPNATQHTTAARYEMPSSVGFGPEKRGRFGDRKFIHLRSSGFLDPQEKRRPDRRW